MSSIPLAGNNDVVPDPDTGRLFDVPRVKVLVDNSDPDTIKLAFGGTIELDRSNAQQVQFYNDLRAGHSQEVVVGVQIAGARMRHKRDDEGDVSEVVQTKTLVVTDVYFSTENEL